MGKASRKKRERYGMDRQLALPLSMQNVTRIRHNQHHHNTPKISACLGELIDLDVMDDITLEQYRKLLMAGTIAWNLANFDEPKRTEELKKITQSIGNPGAHDVEVVVRALIAKKLAQFPNDLRFIAAADVTQSKRSFHITAASISHNTTPSEPQNPDQQKIMNV